MNSTVSRLGNLIAVAVIGLVISRVFYSQVAADRPSRSRRTRSTRRCADASIDGFRAGMVVAAGLAFAGAAIAAVGIVDREDAPAEVSEQAPAPAGS